MMTRLPARACSIQSSPANGASSTGWAGLGVVATHWHAVGAIDYDRDGNPDILWENTSTGERGIWP